MMRRFHGEDVLLSPMGNGFICCEDQQEAATRSLMSGRLSGDLMNWRMGGMKGSILLTALVMLLPCLVGSVDGLAQSGPVPTTIINQPNVSPQSTALDTAAGTLSNGTTAATATPLPGLGATPSSSLNKSYGSAGKGLPGMPGGPAVNGPVGAQDPSSAYMRPRIIPPLLCDPAVELPC